ncbi:hypothetical protein HHX47_DHR6000408 [Lentinula edodes]|nr:hypothetical protein HHX47_DHR6000408 [Lentinula edodes]
MPSADLPDQLDQLAKMLRDLTLMESMPRLQLSSTSEREDMRMAIDSGIDILANLKSYRNALALISFLPDELLSDIFYTVMIAEGPWSQGWCRLMFVCRRWHRVVMDHGRLWSWISEGNPFGYEFHRMKVWEKRSKGFPLSLKFSNKQSTPLFIRNSHRVRLLNVEGPKSDFIHFFGDIRDLPMLESLQLSLRPLDELPATPIYLPSFLVQGGVPRLRVLCLEDVFFESGKQLQVLANLTHLELARRIGNIQPVLPSLRDIYNTIKLSPRENRQMIVKIINALPLEKLAVFDATQVTCNNIEPDIEPYKQQFSWETWRTLVRLLPVGITIRIGVNNAMLALLGGAIDAMKRAPDTFPSGRRLKRLHRQQGVGSLPLSNLVLLASHNIPFRLHGTVDTPDQERLYNGLLDHLVKYRDLNTQLKPKGQPLEALSFEDLRLPFARQFAERLCEVTGKLSYDDILWDPVEMRQQVRRLRKQLRRLRRIHPELDFPEDNLNLSPLSSDSESELESN